MSDSSQSGQLRQSVAGKWQLPLLFVSVVLLVAAVWRLRPAEPQIPFAQYVRQITALQKAGLYIEAGRFIESLLAESRPEQERAQLHRLLGRTIYLAEASLQEHGRENARRIIFNHMRASEAGLAPEAEDLRQVGAAYEWLGRTDEAIRQYRLALRLGPKSASHIRRRIVELLSVRPESDRAELMRQIDALLAEAKDEPAELLWAVQRKVELLLAEERLVEVRGLLDEIRPRLAGTALAGQVDYLDALTCLHSGEYDEAERLVRLLRARLRARDELHAKSGWLLGRLQYQQGRPQYALSAFKDVLDSHTSGPYVAASRLGRAECLAELQRYDEAAEAYEAVVGLIRAGRQGRLVDPAVVRGGLTSLYELLQERGRLEEALRFLELAAELVKPEDLEKRTIYLERVARLREALGRRSRQRADQAKDERVRAELLSASKRHFAAAAGTWLRLSKLNTLREAVGARAAWQAAQDFDAAGQIERVIEVLADFVEQRPGNPQAPQAMFRLGQAYQARGQFGKAIAIYQRLLREHPRTLAAFDAYVPLAGCFLALGGRGYRQAERVLLMVLEEDPSSQGVHTPQAFQFREALFRLGALYARRGEHNKAISRLEDFLEYYPQDGRVSRVRFMLAEAYRKSGLGLRGRLEGETDPARREALLGEYPRRLERAAALYGQVIGDYERRGDSSLSRRERLYLELSYLYRADCVFDLGRYEQAIRLYERAAGRYRDQEAALSAYVQIINCCQRLGRLGQVRTAVERLRWLVRRMPDEGFESLPTGMGRRGWQGLLAWMDRSGLLER